MANKKKKKKKASKRKLSTTERKIGQLYGLREFDRKHIERVTDTLVNVSAKTSDLENLVDGLKQELRKIRDAAHREAELQVQAESMVYRKLIHTLMADRKGVDIFLDRLSDLAPEIAKGVLVGTFEDMKLVDEIRPDRADDGRPPTA